MDLVYKTLKSLDTVFDLLDKIKKSKGKKMVRADDDEGVADDVTKFLEDHPAEMDSDGRPPRIVVLTYQTTAQGYVGAVIVLCIIFTLSLFMALFLFRAGKILTL